MMKVRIIETGAVVELEDDYALRMIEQGRAVLYSGDSAGAAAFETGAILTPVNTNVFTEEKRCHVYRNSEEALAGLTEMGFTSADQLWKNIVKYFAVDPAPNRLVVSCYPKTENCAQAMAALRSIRDDFYGFAYAGVTDDDSIKGVVDYVMENSLKKIMFCSIPNPVTYAIATDGLLKHFYDQECDRFIGLYASQASDMSALMGLAMGLLNASPGERIILRHNNGALNISQSNLDGADIAKIENLNGNLVINISCRMPDAGIPMLKQVIDKGIVSSGKQYEDVLYADMIAAGENVPLKNETAVKAFLDSADALMQTEMRLRNLETRVKNLETAASGT